MRRHRLLTCLLVVIAANAALAAGAAEPATEALQRYVERLRAEGTLDLGDARLAAARLIPLLYEHFEYQPAWTDRAMVDQLLEGVRGAASHGLDPADYHLQAISSRLADGQRQSADPTVRAALDLLLTDSLARLAFTLHFGKLDPEQLDPVWNLSREWNGADPVGLFGKALQSGRIREFLQAAPPQYPFYDRLREALARYRAIEAAGGWPSLPGGGAVKRGDSDPRVPVLRKRLEVEGDLAPGQVADPNQYDADVEAAVQRFQERTGLEPDGEFGKRTTAELNLPVGHRIDQLRASLERARWAFRDVDKDLLLVDIAGFKLHLFRDGKEIWVTRVQVGKPYTSTPIFKSAMTTVVFNPTWTVPPSILRKEILPAVRKDRSYLAAHHMSVVRSDGSIVDPSTVDWIGRFPYSIRQEPGPTNSLGRVKFMFPNEHSVYLHDTPSKQLFARADRAFSHGCIRVEDPLRLAELVLEGTEGWDRAAIDRVVASQQTTTVYLKQRLTVMLLYWTAEVTRLGTVLFSPDIYDRDRAVIEGLDRPFEYRPPRGLPEELSPPPG